MCKALFYGGVGIVIGSVFGLILIMVSELSSTPAVCPLPEIVQPNVLTLE